MYKATWLSDNGDIEVVLKYLDNSNEDSEELLNKWKYFICCLESTKIIKIYGFSSDPHTSNYLVVMDYANKGNLRDNVTEIAKLKWKQRLHMLYEIISGLYEIHNQGLIHYQFCDFKILCHNDGDKNNENSIIDKIYIGGFGLNQPLHSDYHTIIPFMAHEVLRSNSYTPASDIYGFSMIMWEFTSGIPPFIDRIHDFQLALSIYKGERPEIIENTPQCYVDLMKKCWDQDPLKRPSALEVKNIIRNWIAYPFKYSKFNELKGNFMEFINAQMTTKTSPQNTNNRTYSLTSQISDSGNSETSEISDSDNSETSKLLYDNISECLEFVIDTRV
ncbi:hypothetical protein RclHR1_16430004 [Rhizophagus clarus]|uniref:Kinase-like domain-containing protein n=1 Tax=Rhizophagus clarus TaxID=94130 RepID=A0A2Z6QHN0_9GLOM|nr:hypothetical protein RclHR1_16430004 [Rhizophagus clarus]GES97114.1 kinase-like domain-containing protein [Rhizophagus clarus]